MGDPRMPPQVTDPQRSATTTRGSASSPLQRWLTIVAAIGAIIVALLVCLLIGEILVHSGTR